MDLPCSLAYVNYASMFVAQSGNVSASPKLSPTKLLYGFTVCNNATDSDHTVASDVTVVVVVVEREGPAAFADRQPSNRATGKDGGSRRSKQSDKNASNLPVELR